MAKRITRGSRQRSPLHDALAAWHDGRAQHFAATFPGVAELCRQRAELCRTGEELDVDATELCGTLHLAGDGRWRDFQHRSGTATADPGAYWHVDNRGFITGPFLDAA